VRSSADRDTDGWCKQCRKSKNVAYRSRQSAALELARALEARGIEVTRSQPPIDIQQLADALAGRLPEANSQELPDSS
jgi:hypothetical protein